MPTPDWRFWTGALVAVLVAFGLGWGGAWLYSRGELRAVRAEVQAEMLRAASVKEGQLRDDFKKIDEARNENFARIDAALQRVLDGVRKRPERLPDAARPACQGATGAELSAADAEFLAREAARADRAAAERDACYAAYESAQRRLNGRTGSE